MAKQSVPLHQGLSTMVFILTLSACANQTPVPATDTALPAPTVVETLTPTFAPTSTLQDAIDFQKAVKHFNVDFNCEVVCWDNFVPGKTSIKDVVAWMFKLNPEYTPQPGDDYSPYEKPNMFWGSSQVNLGLTYFSDNTQPMPLLRAYAIGIGDKDVPRWLLGAVLQRFGNPKAITIGRPPDYDFDLLLDYGGWGVDYRSNYDYNNGAPINSNVQGQHCPVTKTYVISIWVYSPADGSLFNLIKSMSRDIPNINYGPPFTSLEPLSTETYTTSDSIATFLDGLKTTGCY